MTQINDIHETPLVQTGQKQASSAAAGFQDSLDSALARASDDSAGSGAVAALGEPQPLNFSQRIAPSPAEIAGQTDSLLDLLAAYADGLENPDTTLKDLSALADRMQTEAQQLMASADESTTAESQLKEIAAQTALTATMEYIKFQRGDFL